MKMCVFKIRNIFFVILCLAFVSINEVSGQELDVCQVVLTKEWLNKPLGDMDTSIVSQINSIGDAIALSSFIKADLLIERLQQLARLQIVSGLPILLTYGTNGNCGFGDWHHHDVTREFNFIYVCVGSTCTNTTIPELIKGYNTISYQYLDSINDRGWKQIVDDKIWLTHLSTESSKDTIKRANLAGIYKDELGSKIWLYRDSFRYEYRFDIGYGFSVGKWRLANDTIKFYPDHKYIRPNSIDVVYFEEEIEDLLYKNRKLYRIDEDGSIKPKRVRGTWGRKKRSNCYSKVEEIKQNNK